MPEITHEWKPFAARKTHDIGYPYGSQTRWVAYLRYRDGNLYMVSGLPHPTQQAALIEAKAKLLALAFASEQIRAFSEPTHVEQTA